MSLFRRLYTTLPKPAEVTAPTVARAISSPLQVRRRRLRRRPSSPSPDPSTSLLSPTEQARYERLKLLGAFLKEERGFKEPTEEEWLTELNEKRSRIRGVVQRKVKNPDTGETNTVEDIVGQRIYLPNIVFRMMRNHTPPGQPYNPWEAVFRVPNSVTKLDIRSYLHAVYGIKCTYIRTDNYFAPIWRGKMKGRPAVRKPRKSYKRAVVGLVEPFYYPEALEDMDLGERQIRENWLNENFLIQQTREVSRAKYEALSRPPGWKSFDMAGNRGAILRSVIARRMERERSVNKDSQELLVPST